MKSTIGATGQIATEVNRTTSKLKQYRWKTPILKMVKEDYIAAKRLLMDMEPLHVPLTPIGKNMFEAFNKDGKQKLLIDAPVHEFEKDVLLKTYEIGEKHYGKPELEYSTSEKAAGVDFWRNFFKMGREVTPGTHLRRINGLKVYEKIPHLPFEVTTKVLNASVNIILRMLNFKIKSSNEKDKDWKPPFQSYHTNVGYPYFRNDRSTQNSQTFDDITRKIAKNYEDSDLPNFPAIMIGRDQRGGFEYKLNDVVNTIKNLREFKDSKARVVWATSRIANLKFVRIVKPLIEAAKKTNLFTGYNNDEVILEKAVKMEKFSDSKKAIIYGNDWPQFDAHLTLQLNSVKDYIYSQIITDNYGKKLSSLMTLWGSKMPIITKIDDNNNVVMRHFVGGQKSGEIDTNLGGGIKNAFMTIATQLTMDFDYYYNLHNEAIINNVPSLMVMGDDSVSIFKNMDHVKLFSKTALKLFGTEVNPLKGEKFFFFLQKRLTKSNHFTTPSPRVISKLVWIERPKGLGPYGWTMANLMKLYAIRNNPEFSDIVKWIVKYDDYKLGTYSPKLGRKISKREFVRLLTEESTLEGAPTKARVSDGDPNKDFMFSGTDANSEFINDMLSRIEKAIK